MLTADQRSVHRPRDPARRRCVHGHVGAQTRQSVWTHHGVIRGAELRLLHRAHGHVGAGLRLLWTHGDVRDLFLDPVWAGGFVQVFHDCKRFAPGSD